jgi:uncharacterized protein (TIGR04552 family)
MRRDILELDLSMMRRIAHTDLSLMDVEAIRLVLAGGSVIDWQRLAMRTLDDVNQYLALNRLDLSSPEDWERLRYVFNEAVSFLEERFYLRFPPEVRHPDDVRQVFLWASNTDGFRRRQVLCCVILKLMHVIHHMEAADLKFKAPVAEAGLFDIAEGDILRRARQMRESGLPVISFYGSRKSRSSVITKLIAKKENLATTVFDKLRFRIVVEDRDAVIGTLAYLIHHFIPFNYIIPGQSHNNLLPPDEILARLRDPAELQELLDDPALATTGKNEFSGKSYRMINFIADYPIRLADDVVPGFRFELGRVVFLLVEFQIVDEETARLNETGENAHTLYKMRQYDVVSRRLIRGLRGLDRARRAGKESPTKVNDEVSPLSAEAPSLDPPDDDEPTQVVPRRRE